jgi:GrpB-like predicted nucleotidyltransferase (UPF0157 family)
MASADLPSVEESELELRPHDPEWARQYAREATLVESVFGERCAAIEHIGSTAVPELVAKPIVDILVGSIDGSAPTHAELHALSAQHYVFLGEDGRRPGRWFWRKRGRLSFNVNLVPFTGDLWLDNLALRDYLRSHPIEANQYAAIKREALAASPNSLLGYQNYKRDFVSGLRVRALEWRRRV